MREFGVWGVSSYGYGRLVRSPAQVPKVINDGSCYVWARLLERTATPANIRERRMYGKVLGAGNVATGVAVLPNTGDSRLLFAVASGLLVSGVAILVVAAVLARKSRRAATN